MDGFFSPEICVLKFGCFCLEFVWFFAWNLIHFGFKFDFILETAKNRIEMLDISSSLLEKRLKMLET